MKTPIHNIEVYAVEVNDQYGIRDLKIALENALDNYLVAFGKCKTKDAGEWSDDHKLNKTTTNVPKYFDKL